MRTKRSDAAKALQPTFHPQTLHTRTCAGHGDAGCWAGRPTHQAATSSATSNTVSTAGWLHVVWALPYNGLHRFFEALTLFRLFKI
jgi:hypothetical protein